MSNPKNRKNRANQSVAKPLRFEQRLVLLQWMLGLFGVTSFEQLAANLRAPELEGFDENNVSRFHHQLRLLFDRPDLSNDMLLAYDQNIVRHWRKIVEKRNRGGALLYPKYFQYLALLFTEIYLDRYFSNPENLLAQLNEYVEKFNEQAPEASQINPYQIDDLNKLAFWMATGSGKTLLMHIHIMQYLHYRELHGGKPINRIILLTPNEGLSYQHLEEFQLSGIDAELFSKEGRGVFAGNSVEIIDIHKLRDEMGEKTVAVEAFEGNNLVLVDEGHRGTSSAETGAWMQKRNQLCEQGFSFEYSATFGQAMKASGNRELEQTYARCILFDYSYKYFYNDGYGKDYRILNLTDDSDETVRRRYITACLLSFYQQLKLYSEHKSSFKPFLIERPLWIFVGGSVNAVRSENKRKVSDVVDILLLLAEFVQDRAGSEADINKLLSGTSGLLDAQGRDIFAGSYQYLVKTGLSAQQAYDDILRVIFNASSPAALHVENLKGTDGEVALRLGENEAFGVINVGDASSLCKLCEEHKQLVVIEKEFSDSLFRNLNNDSSSINILIGSKKFTEGWSSWRVSTMGLMNIGRNEGPQIIQLFGRGVRLKGKDFSLKRSRRLEGHAAPRYIETLETLNIFGIRADYMRQFKEYLEEEGLPTNEDRIEFVLPVIKNLGNKKLKIIRLKEGVDFKKNGEKVTLEEPFELFKRYPVVVDWYPKLQAMASGAGQTKAVTAEKNMATFSEKHVSFLNFEELYFELQQFKNERNWYNLSIPRDILPALLLKSFWYELYIPNEVMEFHSFDQVKRWQEIATVLLKKYIDRFYKLKKQEYEQKFLEYQELSEDDPNFIEEYYLLIEKSREDIVQKLQEIKELITAGKLKEAEFSRLAFEQDSIRTIAFAGHLYQPLVYVNSDLIEIKPVVLENQGERDFVLDLQKFCDSPEGKDLLKGKQLYLLRNLSRGRGIGFFEAGNFYPDFILWLLIDDKQYVNFIDPKGLRNLEGLEDPKIRFHKTIKDLENLLNDPNVILNSFIISGTHASEIAWWSGGMGKEEFEKHNVLFQLDDREEYIKKLLMKCCSKIGS
ncbi:MAG: DEAD/DEAH box helicase family protein [Acidobacterium ailaaui]|nr:DEAD/DEAH box helicase family protein [Pseudacidobacterium ailaaui]